MKIGAGLACGLALLAATPAAAVVVVAVPTPPVEVRAVVAKVPPAGRSAPGTEPLALVMLALAIGIFTLGARSARQLPTVAA